MNKEKDLWIEDVLSAIEETKHLKPSDAVHQSILSRLENSDPVENKQVTFLQFRMAIAAVLTLIFLNIGFFSIEYLKQLPNKKAETSYLNSYNLNLY